MKRTLKYVIGVILLAIGSWYQAAYRNNILGFVLGTLLVIAAFELILGCWSKKEGGL